LHEPLTSEHANFMHTDTINLPHIARQFYLEPLALEESAMLACHLYLWPRISGQVSDVQPMAASKQSDPNDVKYTGAYGHMRRQIAAPAMQSNGPFAAPTILDANYYWTIDGKPGVAVIPVNGMISKGAGPFAESCMGAVNPDRISHALGQAMANKDIKQIVLDIGSPGGRVTYIPELAAQVRAAAQTRGKTVWAFTDTHIASAATWIASQANEIITTPSASIGSIGTYLAFLNPKVAMQMQGYSLELFSKGTHKALGLPGKDLTQADREYLQTGVDKINAQFVEAVKMGRKRSSEEAIRDAKMYDGADAISHGLSDGLAASWDDFVSLL
jgi:signal peptide peptidase SppA